MKVPVRVDGGRVRLGVTKHRLTDRDVLRRIVCPRAQTVTEAVPAETLTFERRARAQERSGLPEVVA